MSALAAADGGIVVLFVIFAIAIFFFGIVQAGARRSNLETVARKFQGEVTSSWMSDTDLEMAVDGVPAHLSYHAGSKNRRAYTRLRFKMPVGGRLRVVPDGIWESLKKAFWSEDLTIGEPAFDDAYIVQGHPTDWVRRVLDAPSRARVNRLAELGAGLTLEAGPAGVLVALPRNVVGDLAALEEFIGASIDLFRALRSPAEEGVKFLSAEELVAEGSCPVCEHKLEVDLRRCTACATPHHAECWTYFGGCSTYACKENP